MTRLREGPEYFAVNAYANGYRTLMAGFTTVRDLDRRAIPCSACATRSATASSPALKIIAAGEGISPTNGHADAYGLRRDLMEAQIRPASQRRRRLLLRRARRDQIWRATSSRW